MKRHSFLLLAIILLLKLSIQSTQAQQKTVFNTARLTRIADVQKDFLSQDLVGSNRVVLVKDGKILYDKTFNSEKPGDMRINNETLFPIWSMTKPIVTVATMILYEQGKLMLHDPIERYLPEMKNLNCVGDSGKIYPCKRKVTVYDLLTHQSGWGYYPGSVNGKNYLITDTPFQSLQDFSEKISKKPLAFEPGTNYRYGINTALLGHLIEVISGLSLQEFLSKNIFVPLEMTNTKFSLSEKDRKRFQPLYHYEKGKGEYTNAYDELSYSEESKVQLGGEGLVSTTTDYMHFCEMLLQNGKYKDKLILSPASVALMHTALVPENEDGAIGPGFSYGFTFFNLTNSVGDGGLSPEGIFGWGGYHSTYFWIDQKNNLYGLIMMRRTPTYFSFWRKIRVAVYQALTNL